jgi:excisionase family DNA binding protein
MNKAYKNDSSQLSEANSARYCNRKELAAYLGKSPAHITKLAAKRVIPSIRVPGSARMFEKEKVVAALERFQTKEIGHE